MSSEDIASQLLQSADARIAEAAKRVFSSFHPTTSSLGAPSVSRSSSTCPYYYDEDRRGGEIHALSVVAGKLCGEGTTTKHTVDGQNKRLTTSLLRQSSYNESHHEDIEDEDKKLSSTERLQRSRERNRMHARKTRQRKKEHMQKLQNRADKLKLEQIRLRQAINEKNTASILVGLFQSENSIDENVIDPRVDALLKRKVEDIPDASKIPELPALILPGQHSNKKKSEEIDDHQEMNSEEDGIDYELLGKDRAACSPAELDKIRRERNRMHAKRTRDRKRIFMEEMEVMIRQLEEENALLQDHVDQMNGNIKTSSDATSSSHAISPDLRPAPTPFAAPVHAPISSSSQHSYVQESSSHQPQAPPPESNTRGDFRNQIESLLAAAGAFERPTIGEINAISCAESDVTASTNNSEHNSLCEEDAIGHCCKKQRLNEDVARPVPSSITTTKLL